MKLKEVIVVEGKHDTQRLKQFFDVDTIETHGLSLTQDMLEQLKELQTKRGIILFLDPDSAGNRIRQRINDYIPNVKNAFIDKKKARTTKKVGVEHASKEDLQEALENITTFDKTITETLSYEDFISFGLSGQSDAKQVRAYIGNRLFLGECNAKTLFKRLNMFQIKKEELETIIKEYYE